MSAILLLALLLISSHDVSGSRRRESSSDISLRDNPSSFARLMNRTHVTEGDTGDTRRPAGEGRGSAPAYRNTVSSPCLPRLSRPLALWSGPSSPHPLPKV
jgi:hypothetical protein